ncbi:Cytochrome P450 3A31 [Hypsibius exemplaris]|uniref:Cytochrome P450 3A31 n=1 Tax=Hypsibius exemplaris TaxID=2072580 RepID=A0A9X6RMB6_HYPEX|nr:Cytochrome P450 3A31 [Hypsibius exemplaris]
MGMLDLGATPWLLAAMVGLLTYWFRIRAKKFDFFRDRGIPGPKPSLLDGNYQDLMQSKMAPWVVMEKWFKAYGKVVGYFRIGPNPVFLLFDHDMLKEVLIKDFSRFSDRPTLVNPKDRDSIPAIFRYALTMITGQDWKRVRSTIAPTFTAKKMKGMSPKMNGIMDVMLGILDDKAHSGETIDIYGLFQGLTLDVIGNCAFAMNTDCLRNPDEIFLASVKTIFAGFSSPIIRFLQMFPEFNFFIGRLIKLTAHTQRGNELSGHLENLIKQRREGKLNGHMDMIQLMLDANENPESVDRTDNGDAFSDVRKKYLTEAEMISNAFLFLLAGYETTANCLAFTTYLLAKHPDIQERVYEEIRDELGLQTTPDYEKAQNLPYLEMVIAESLRLFPPVTSFVTRLASETVTIDGVTIPAGAGVEVPLWYLQHDPEVWDRPYEFNPERFSPENKSSIPPMAYMPFGAGPRNCVGMRFAQLEIKIAFVRILQRFRLTTCWESEPEIKLKHTTVSISPANGVFVRLEKRLAVE